jgi:hypothetical protein
MKHYTVQELNIKDGSELEQIRTRKIFEDLKEKAVNKKVFLEREKDFFYTGLKLSELNDGQPEDFDVCKDPIFKELYLTYFHSNLSEPFFKHKKGKGIVEVGHKEKVKDFKALINISDIWEKEIMIQNHKNKILQELSIETRRDLNKLDIKYPRLLRRFRKSQDEYRLKKDKIILHSKFIYLLVKSVIENNNAKDFQIPFSGETVEFTVFSLIHIVSRHYAEPIKDNSDKTYHYENFYPTELHIDLNNILLEIDKVNLIDIKETDNIVFKFKNIVYQLYIQKKWESRKGKGNVQIFRVQTFYPIYSKSKINSIVANYNEIELNQELSVYIPK